jgi:myo-inositol-1(or 4)-monophosphatase
MDGKLASWSRLAGDGREIKDAVMCHSIRSIGSAACNYAYVAAGQMDLYWCVRLRPFARGFAR